MAEYFPEGRALFHCSAFPACFVPFGNRAVPYRAAQAVAYFRAWLPAPGSVQTFGWAFEAGRIGGKVMLIGIPREEFVGFNPHSLRRRG
jgi:hypothetical protein